MMYQTVPSRGTLAYSSTFCGSDWKGVPVSSKVIEMIMIASFCFELRALDVSPNPRCSEILHEMLRILISVWTKNAAIELLRVGLTPFVGTEPGSPRYESSGESRSLCAAIYNRSGSD